MGYIIDSSMPPPRHSERLKANPVPPLFYFESTQDLSTKRKIPDRSQVASVDVPALSHDIATSEGEAPLPPDAVPIPTSDPDLPSLYILQQHKKVVGPRGKIVMAVYDWRAPAMKRLFAHVAKMDPPASEQERIRRGEQPNPVNAFFDKRATGFYLLTPSENDRLVLRHRYGSGREEDDVLGSWSQSRSAPLPLPMSRSHPFRASLPDDMIEGLEDLRDRLLGPQEEMSPDKAALKDGRWDGGIAFERSPRALSLGNAPRCYSVSLVNQVQKTMSAPGAQAKMLDLVKDDDAQLRFDLVNRGARNAMRGLETDPDGLIERLQIQASLTNLPRVGFDGNVGFPNLQLNVASAVEHVPEHERSKITNLGKFGGSHIDGRDSAGSLTAMLVLSPEHEGIEDQCFYIMELGIAWRLEPLSTIYFSGLRCHGGCQPRYKADRKDRSVYTRLALIAYPNDDILSGQEATAFASLPNKGVLVNGYEWRDA